MSQPNVRRWAIRRRVFVVFAALVAVPLLLTVNSFRPIVTPPSSLLSIVETLFRLFAYYPVQFVRQLLFAPIGVDGVFKIPVVSHLFVLVSLFAFYYAASLVLVFAWDRLRDSMDR